jgi:predicted PurR-regulated permease PerM
MTMNRARVENGGLILFLAAITIALILVVSSFIGALLWAALAALLFQPLFQRLLARWPERRNLAAAVALLVISVAVVIPALIITSLVVEQAAGVYAQMRDGQINFAEYFQKVHDALPLRVQTQLDSFGFNSFERAQARISEAVSNSVSLIASRALAIGANAASFILAFGVGLYVTFFLLRDGDRIGPAIVWAPVAVYLLATGAIWQGAVVIGSGVLVIGLADNVLRPMLVGRDTGIPDWLVLVTTLGGIELVGLSGIVLGPLAGALFMTGWTIMTEQRFDPSPDVE